MNTGASLYPVPVQEGGLPLSLVTTELPFHAVGNSAGESFPRALPRSLSRGTSPVAPRANAIYDTLVPRAMTRLAGAMAFGRNLWRFDCATVFNDAFAFGMEGEHPA